MNRDKEERLKKLIKEKSLLIKAEGEKQKFELASKGKSNFFFDMKKVSLDPEGANLIAEAILERIKDEDVGSIGGLESGAIPIVASVVAKSSLIGRPIPGFFVRKKPKERGTKGQIEGNLKNNSIAIVLDDVTTKGNSVLIAVEKVRESGCIVNDVITIVDRLEGAKENLAKSNVNLIPLFTRDDFGIEG